MGSGYLRLNDFKKLIESTPGIKRVFFENRGELFLNPEFAGIMRFARGKNIEMYCDSGVNLNAVSEDVLEEMVRCGFRSLLVSIDGTSPETYSIYRVGGDFDRVIGNVKKINRYKKKYNTIYPVLTWQFIVFGHNEHELPAARKAAESLNMTFSPKMSWDSEFSPVMDKAFVMKETGWPAVTREEYARVTGKEYVRSVCYALWTAPRVNWDGKILGCCWNSWGEFGGNAFTDGYSECVNGRGIGDARAMLTGKSPFLEGLPCSTCELYEKIRKSGKYLRRGEIFRSKRIWFRFARYVYKTLNLERARSKLRGIASRISGR